MAIKRTSEAEWTGSVTEGKGKIKLGSGAFEGAYSFNSRFGDEPATNPEELIAAAHAGCFTMALSATLGRAGFAPTKIETNLGRAGVAHQIAESRRGKLCSSLSHALRKVFSRRAGSRKQSGLRSHFS